MDNVYLSKSKYCRAKQCNKMLWMDRNKPEEAMPLNKDSVFETGTRVGELAKHYFGEYVDIEFNKDLSKMIEQTQKELKRIPNIIAEASFDYNNNFCSVDILKNDKDGIEIYEVKSSTEISDVYLEDVSYQVYVLLNLGYNVKKANIMYINNQYVRQGELDLQQLFNVEDVTEIAYSRQKDTEDKIKEINEYMQVKKERDEKIGMQCFEPYECAYWKYCTKHLPEKNVFSISGMYKTEKFALYNNGIVSYNDLEKEDIKEKFKEQINIELSNEKIIKKTEIQEFLNTLTYPIYFLDFETFQQAIPQYDGIRPYMRIPFQYSLHYIEKENGELKHTEYLAPSGIEPRRELAEHLVKDIPENVCVVAYNMSFEKSVIRELAEQFEDLSNKLMNIHDNIKDLMIPFQKRWYYTKKMEGSYSIKYVLPALFPNEPDLDYHNLPVVHNGDEASSVFGALGGKTKEEQEIIRDGLLKYCKLDTLAMVKVWGKLKEV